MQNLIVAIIVGLAAFLLLRKFIRSIKAVDTNACGCGCSTCPEMTSCDAPREVFIEDKRSPVSNEDRE